MEEIELCFKVIFLERLCADFCEIILVRYTKNLSFALYCIVANIAKLIGAVDLLLANSASSEADQSLDTVKQLLELLAGVGEGSG